MKGLHEMTVPEMYQALVQRTFEANLILRALSLHGIRVTVDVVERTNVAHPEGYPEILMGAPNVAG